MPFFNYAAVLRDYDLAPTGASSYFTLNNPAPRGDTSFNPWGSTFHDLTDKWSLPSNVSRSLPAGVAAAATAGAGGLALLLVLGHGFQETREI